MGLQPHAALPVQPTAYFATVGLTLPVLVNPAARDQIAIDPGRLG